MSTRTYHPHHAQDEMFVAIEAAHQMSKLQASEPVQFLKPPTEFFNMNPGQESDTINVAIEVTHKLLRDKYRAEGPATGPQDIAHIPSTGAVNVFAGRRPRRFRVVPRYAPSCPQVVLDLSTSPELSTGMSTSQRECACLHLSDPGHNSSTSKVTA